MTMYEKLIQSVKNGNHFEIDLINKTLKINGKYIVKGGDCDDELITETDENPWDRIKELYDEYRTSVPSRHSLSSRKYFKALDYTELNTEQMAMNEDRNIAQAKLECYILCMAIKGKLSEGWKEKQWFWRDVTREGLYIFKEWC